MSKRRPKKRRVIWIDAGDLHAGDILAVDEGDRRVYYHVCEIGVSGHDMYFIWKTEYGFDREKCEVDDQVRIRVIV